MDAKETLIRIVLPALLIYAALCLASARRELIAADAVEASLRLRLETIEQDNLAVSEKLTEGWSTEELERPGDRVYHFPSDSRAQKP